MIDRYRSALVIALFAAAVACGRSHASTDAEPTSREGEDAESFCRVHRSAECYRDRSAARLDDDGLMTCLDGAELRCGGVMWLPGCEPTPEERDACLALLQRSDLADLTTEELYAMFDDCDLCP